MEDNEDFDACSAAAAFGAFDTTPTPRDTVTPVDVADLDDCGFLSSGSSRTFYESLAMCA